MSPPDEDSYRLASEGWCRHTEMVLSCRAPPVGVAGTHHGPVAAFTGSAEGAGRWRFGVDVCSRTASQTGIACTEVPAGPARRISREYPPTLVAVVLAAQLAAPAVRDNAASDGFAVHR